MKTVSSHGSDFYLSRLEDHRHLLCTAIDGMASGDLTQALHVAVHIRTLVHETGKSKPLLKYLNQNYLELPILHNDVESKRKDHGDGRFSMTITMPLGVSFSKDGIRLNKDLKSKTYREVPLGNWWNGICLDLPGLERYSRREIVLGVANKEGAHVDADIDKKYETLLTTKFVQFAFSGGTLDTLNMSRILVGRSGVELLDCLEKNFPPPNAAAV